MWMMSMYYNPSRKCAWHSGNSCRIRHKFMRLNLDWNSCRWNIKLTGSFFALSFVNSPLIHWVLLQDTEAIIIEIAQVKQHNSFGTLWCYNWRRFYKPLICLTVLLALICFCNASCYNIFCNFCIYVKFRIHYCCIIDWTSSNLAVFSCLIHRQTQVNEFMAKDYLTIQVSEQLRYVRYLS